MENMNVLVATIKEELNPSLLDSYLDYEADNKKALPVESVIEEIVEKYVLIHTKKADIVAERARQSKAYKKKKKRWRDALHSDAAAYDLTERKYPFRDLAQKRKVLDDAEWKQLYGELSFEELEQQRMAEVDAWCDNDEGYFFEFPAIVSKTPTNRYKGMYSDLIREVFGILEACYGSDLKNVSKPYIAEMFENPLFTNSRKRYHPNDREGGITQEVPMRDRQKLIVSISSEVFRLYDGANMKGVTMLDVKDQEILNYLIQLKAADPIEEIGKPLLVENGVLAQMISKQSRPSTNHYKEAERRLIKIAEVGYRLFDRNGENVGYINFLDSVLPREVSGKKYTEIRMGQMVTEAIINKKITWLTANYYNKLTDVTAKLLYQGLMIRRVQMMTKDDDGMPRSRTVIFELEDFLCMVNFGSNNKKENLKKIKTALDDYKRNKDVIEDYKIVANRRVHVTFTPLTDAEKADMQMMPKPDLLPIAG